MKRLVSFKISNISKANLFSSLRYYFYILLSVIIFGSLLELLGISLPTEKKQENYPLLLLVFETLLIAPLLEELSFRTYLNLKTRNILISLICAFVFLLIAVFNHNELIIYPLILFLVYLSVLGFLAHTKRIRNSIITSKVLIFIGALFFAFLHINRIETVEFLEIYTYLHIMPYFFMGIGLACARLRLGLVYAIFIHFLINLPSILIVIFKTI